MDDLANRVTVYQTRGPLSSDDHKICPNPSIPPFRQQQCLLHPSVDFILPLFKAVSTSMLSRCTFFRGNAGYIYFFHFAPAGFQFLKTDKLPQSLGNELEQYAKI
jgi:hypothetical protein